MKTATACNAISPIRPISLLRQIGRPRPSLLLGLMMVVSACFLETSANAGSTRINTCPFVITAPGTYMVTQDLICSGSAITILADNVDLNLGGHTISGDGSGVGISVQGGSNVSIRRGTVDNFFFGIHLLNTLANKLSNLTVQHGLNGIVGENAVGTTITANAATQNGDVGIVFIGDSRGNTLTHNTANQNLTAGIILSNGGLGSTITDNTANQNGVAGIVLGPAIANTVARNTANQNDMANQHGGAGIRLTGAVANSVTDNTANENGNVGIGQRLQSKRQARASLFDDLFGFFL